MVMQINKFMPHSLLPYFRNELQQSKVKFACRNYHKSWQYLERAHILGQPYALEHTIVHWKMLCFALRIKNVQEIIGQLPRLLVGGIKSFGGKIPLGNTGGSNVSPLKPMEIPKDLALLIEQYGTNNNIKL